MNIRRLTENDWNTLVSWWNAWPDWPVIPKEFLPDNGTGGFIVESNDIPIVAGFVYMTNSKAALLEWVISNPDYRNDDRKQAVELLITAVERVLKDHGIKFIFSIGRNKSLIETHKKLGWHVDNEPSYELLKTI